MKNKELFEKSVKILVNAYLNDTLNPLSACACAVGNLISGNLDAEPTSDISPNFILKNGDEVGVPWSGYGSGCYIQMDVTKIIGYTPFQIHKIEMAFMGKSKGEIFNRLMIVVDALCQIHEMNDTTKQETKALFVKPETM